MFVGAEFGWVQEELDEDVACYCHHQADPQQSRDHTVQEQPAGPQEEGIDETTGCRKIYTVKKSKCERTQGTVKCRE